MSKFVGAYHYKKPGRLQMMRHKYRSFELWSTIIRLPIIFLFIPLITGSILFYVYIIRELPDLKKVESLSLSQTTTITDRNGEVLYRVFEENREYVPLSKISVTMQNAIIAAEDKSFWTNAGVDFGGMARALLRDIGSSGPSQWWSTITQQLVKNLLLTPEQTLKRKLKELVLTIQLWDLLEDQVAKSNPTISNKERERKVKEKILELYLNYIFLGNNSYWVQAASKWYFGITADKLNVLEAAVVASIPKAPSKFDPYKNRPGLVWELEIKNYAGEKVAIDDIAYQEVLNKVKSVLDDSRVKSKTSTEDMLKYLQWLISFDFTHNNELYKVTYSPWRKDYVLSRMYEDGYLSIEEFKDALILGMNYKFNKGKITIDSPHFVFWVLDILKEPNNKYIGEYGEDILKRWWLVIRTTLDNKIQQMAVDSVNESISSIKWYGGNNTALIHLDSKNGDVLAYVWSADYYNEAIDGNVDVVQRMRQPWSSIKPFWYALGFMKTALTIDTNIFDIPFKLWDYDPDNVDGKFMGPMPLRRALAFSRNIPAIKMYFAAGEQDGFIDFAKDLGVYTFDKKKDYGPPMAIGSAEMEMFDLAKMYAHLSAEGKPGEIDPILEVRWPDGSLLYKKSDARPKQVIPSWVAYLIRKILSDPANLPADWARKFSFPGIKFAHKTGTSNRRSGDKVLPRDGWLATYTPSKVTVFWAGNTSGKPMHADAYGWWVNHGTRNKFWTKLKTNGYIRNEDMKPVEVKQLTIAKYSGKLATNQTPEVMKVTTWWYINNLPTETDGGIKKVEIDKLCMGKVSDLTPQSDIITVYINEPQTFMPDKRDLKDIMRYTGEWYSVEMFDAQGQKLSQELIYKEPTEECLERRFLSWENKSGGLGLGWENISWSQPAVKPGEVSLSLSIIKPTADEQVWWELSVWFNANSSEQITTISISVNGTIVETILYNKPSVTDVKKLDISWLQWNIIIGLKATSESGKTVNQSVSVKMKSTTSSNQLPTLLVNQTTIKADNGKFQVTLFFSDPDGSVKEGTVSQWWSPIANFNGSISTLELDSLGVIEYTVRDHQWGIKQWTVDLKQVSNQI